MKVIKASFGRVSKLKMKVRNIPDHVSAYEICIYLGWSEELDVAVDTVAKQGIDFNFLLDLAPDFRDIMSILVSSAYGFPYPPNSFDWEDVLHGDVPEFPGRNAKERLLAVLEQAKDAPSPSKI